MFTIVCPVSSESSRSFEQFLTIGIPSYDCFLPKDEIDSFIIISPLKDRDTLQKLTLIYPDIPFRFYTDEEMLNDLSIRGWSKQQIIKLKISSKVKTSLYIPVDGDHFLVKPLSYSDLYRDDKIKCSTEPYQTLNNVLFSVNSEWVNKSAKCLLFTGTLDKIMSVTPQILVKPFVSNLLETIDVESAMAKGATEFCLYWLFLLQNDLTSTYIDCTNDDPLWRHDREINVLEPMNKDKVNEVVFRALAKQKTYFSVIQSWIGIDTEFLNETIVWEECDLSLYNTLVKELQVYDNDFPQFRLAGPHDGGYTIFDLGIKYNALYGYGVGNNVNFERCFLDKYPDTTECHLYDHTVEKPPLPNPKMTYHSEGIAWYKNGPLNTLENHTEGKEGNLFLKMDVEGYEFLSLLTTPDSILNKFCQIVIEVHWLTTTMNATLKNKIRFFQKLNSLFYLSHIHPNNCNKIVRIGELEIVNVLELVYIRKDILPRVWKTLRTFPTPFDTPNDPYKSDLPYPYNRKIENIVLICSILSGSPGSVYSKEDRLKQTEKTIKTVREKIPNSYIVLAEISDISEEEKKFLNADYTQSYYNDFLSLGYISPDKTLGELYLINKTFEWIEEKASHVPYKRIFKIGGRNWLNDSFNIEDHNGEINCKINPSQNDIYMTLLSFSKGKFSVLKSIMSTAYYTNCFGKYLENGLFDLISHLKDVNYLTNLGCSGTFSMTGSPFSV